MADNAKTIPRIPRSRRIAKYLLWLCGLFLIGVILIITALFFLPRAVSTNWFKGYLETYTSKTIGRPLYIDRLTWTWSKGILLEGVSIPDAPSFSQKPLVAVERTLLALNLEELLHRRVVFGFEMDGLELHLIRNVDGRTNLEHFLSQLPHVQKQAQKPEAKPAPADQKGLPIWFPTDVSGHIQLKRVSFSIEDKPQNRSFSSRNTSLSIKIPSLIREPVTLDLSSALVMDGIQLPPLHLSLEVKDLVNPEAPLSLSKASGKIKGSFPGLNFSANGGLSERGVSAQLALDLAPLSRMARQFFPGTFPNPSGKLNMTLKALLTPENAIDFTLAIKGTELAASGGQLKTNRVGPIRVVFSEKGVIDLKNKALHIKSGDIRIQHNSRLHFQGTVNSMGDLQPQVDLTISSLFFDLRELLHLGKPFLPKGVVLDTKEGAVSPPELKIKILRFTGSSPKGPNLVNLKGLSLSLPFIRLKTRNGTLSVNALDFQIQTGDVHLESNFPTKANLQAGLELGNILVTGKKKIQLRRLVFPTFRMTARDMDRNPSSFLGLKGNISIRESGTLEGLVVGKDVQVPLLQHSLKTNIVFGPKRSLTINDTRVVVSAPEFHLETLPHGPLDSGLDLDVDLSRLHLMDLNPLRVNIKNLKLRLALKGLLDARVKTSIRDAGRKFIKTDGKIALNLNNIFPLLANRLPRHTDLKGIVDLEWYFGGRLPTPKEKKAFFDIGTSLYKKLKSTPFIENVQVKAHLKDVETTVLLSKNRWLKASQIRTDAPLTLTLSKNMKEGSVTGKIFLGSIKELPFLGILKPPVQVSLTISGAQEGLRSIQFSETMELAPLGLKQSLDISLNRIDQLLKKGVIPPLPAFLKVGEGSVTATFKARSVENLPLVIKDVVLKGSLEAGTQIQLTGDSRVIAKVWLKSHGLDATYGPKIRITGLKTHLELKKSLRIGGPTQDRSPKPPPPSLLSKKVLQTEAKTQALTEARKTMSRRLMDDIRGRLASRPTLTFRSARIEAGTLPVEISNYELDLRLVESLPSFDHFQFDVMGGSVVGELYVRKTPKGFEMETKCSFSGLNPNFLLPRPAREASDNQPEPLDNADLSGQLSLQFPLTNDPARLLYGTRLTIRLTQIGARAFERFLYALDPYESNENIVKQRELLRMGTPLWITLQVRYGNLSLSGEVEVKGVRIRLPRIERLNIAALPIHAQIEDRLSAIGPIVNILKNISADSIILEKNGTFRMVSSGRE